MDSWFISLLFSLCKDSSPSLYEGQLIMKGFIGDEHLKASPYDRVDGFAHGNAVVHAGLCSGTEAGASAQFLQSGSHLD